MKPRKDVLIVPKVGTPQQTANCPQQDNGLTENSAQDDPSPAISAPDATGWENVLDNELGNKGNFQYFVIRYEGEDPLFFSSHDAYLEYISKRPGSFRRFRSRIFTTAFKFYEDRVQYSQSIPWGLKKSMIQKVRDEERSRWGKVIANDDKLKMW